MRIQLDGEGWVEIQGEMGRQGVLTSNLRSPAADEEAQRWNDMVDGFEATTLALFSHLPPTVMAEFERGVQTAAEALANQV